MSSNNSMPAYYRCEADGCHTIGPYMNRYYCKDFFSIDLKRIDNAIKEESLEEMVIKKNKYIYDSNNIHIIKVEDTVMNIENLMKSGIVVAFENERNNVLMMVDSIEMNIVSMNKVRYMHPNNTTLISTLACS